jgi:hypothetical protein
MARPMPREAPVRRIVFEEDIVKSGCWRRCAKVLSETRCLDCDVGKSDVFDARPTSPHHTFVSSEQGQCSLTLRHHSLHKATSLDQSLSLLQWMSIAYRVDRVIYSAFRRASSATRSEAMQPTTQQIHGEYILSQTFLDPPRLHFQRIVHFSFLSDRVILLNSALLLLQNAHSIPVFHARISSSRPNS